MAIVTVEMQGAGGGKWTDVTSRTNFPLNLSEGRDVGTLGGAVPSTRPAVLTGGVFDDDFHFTRDNPLLVRPGARVRVRWGESAGQMVTRFVGQLAQASHADRGVLRCEWYGPLARITAGSGRADRLFVRRGAADMFRAVALSAGIPAAAISADANERRYTRLLPGGLAALQEIERASGGVSIEMHDGTVQLELPATRRAREAKERLTDLEPHRAGGTEAPLATDKEPEGGLKAWYDFTVTVGHLPDGNGEIHGYYEGLTGSIEPSDVTFARDWDSGFGSQPSGTHLGFRVNQCWWFTGRIMNVGIVPTGNSAGGYSWWYLGAGIEQPYRSHVNPTARQFELGGVRYQGELSGSENLWLTGQAAPADDPFPAEGETVTLRMFMLPPGTPIPDALPGGGEALERQIPRPRRLTQSYPTVNMVEVDLALLAPKSSDSETRTFHLPSTRLQVTPGDPHRTIISFDSRGIIRPGSTETHRFVVQFGGNDSPPITGAGLVWNTARGDDDFNVQISGVQISHDGSWISVTLDHTANLTDVVTITGTVVLNNGHGFDYETRSEPFRAADWDSIQAIGERAPDSPYVVGALVRGLLPREYILPADTEAAVQAIADRLLEQYREPAPVYALEEWLPEVVLARRVWDKLHLRLEDGTEGEFFVEALETEIWDVIPITQTAYVVAAARAVLTDPPPEPDEVIGEFSPQVHVISVTGDTLVRPGETLEVQCIAVDPDPGHQGALAYQWSVSPQWGSFDHPNAPTAVYRAPSAAEAPESDIDVTISCAVTDPDDFTGTGSIVVSIDIPDTNYWSDITRLRGYAVDFTAGHLATPMLRTGAAVSADAGALGQIHQSFPADMYTNPASFQFDVISQHYYTRTDSGFSFRFNTAMQNFGVESAAGHIPGGSIDTDWRLYVIDVATGEYIRFGVVFNHGRVGPAQPGSYGLVFNQFSNSIPGHSYVYTQVPAEIRQIQGKIGTYDSDTLHSSSDTVFVWPEESRITGTATAWLTGRRRRRLIVAFVPSSTYEPPAPGG